MRGEWERPGKRSGQHGRERTVVPCTADVVAARSSGPACAGHWDQVPRSALTGELQQQMIY
jgi:hypothetical protein